MSDESTPAGTPAPAPAPVPAPVVVAPAPTPAPVVDQSSDPAWLPGRLARASESAKAALLQELGVTNPDEAKSAIAAAKAAADAKKSAEERAAELAAQLNASKSHADKQAAYAREMAGRMLMALTGEQQKAVTDFAGDDPLKQYEAIKHFGPTWAAAEAAKEAAQKAAEEAAKAAKPPAQTSPAPGAPAGEVPTSPEDPKSVYQSTRSKNPFAAAAYGFTNPTVYER